MSHWVYIIYSPGIDRYYIGYSTDPAGRLRKHNASHIGFTGRAKDWQLVYSEKLPDKEKAIERERELKSWKSRKKLEKLIKKQSL